MCKVLLVDDEHLELEALRMILQQAPEKIEIIGEATTGKKAVEICASSNPDMIFMDIKLPGMDGLEATELIKQRDPNQVIILFAGCDDYQCMQKAFQAGANECLCKPIRPTDIHRILSRYKMPQKPDKPPMNDAIEKLMQRIQAEDYKGAKEQLKNLFQEILEQSESLEQLRKSAQSIADYMGKIYEAKGLQDMKGSKHWTKLGDSLMPYQLEEQLSKQLDTMFDEIIYKRSIEEKNEIQAVLNYIERNYPRGVTLEEAAEYVHLSPHYLSKLFKKELQVNFVNYVMERRIELAKELLEHTDMPVLNIALELSYQEHNYFSKVFKKVVGVTPSEYRKEKEKQKEQKNQSLMKRYSCVSNGKWFI